MRLFISLVIALTSYALYGQNSQSGHFLVEFEAFSPPVKDMVTSFEGHIAEQFLAKDVNGKEHFLGDYKGKKVILWFWSISSEKAKLIAN